MKTENEKYIIGYDIGSGKDMNAIVVRKGNKVVLSLVGEEADALLGVIKAEQARLRGVLEELQKEEIGSNNDFAKGIQFGMDLIMKTFDSATDSGEFYSDNKIVEKGIQAQKDANLVMNETIDNNTPKCSTCGKEKCKQLDHPDTSNPHHFIRLCHGHQCEKCQGSGMVKGELKTVVIGGQTAPALDIIPCPSCNPKDV